MSTSAADRFMELVELVRTLRSPGGCPWDRAQTLETLRPFVLEETYEVLEAIDRADRHALREELGDFIFEAVLLAQLASEAGDFTVADSLAAINQKLVRRHPHVFGSPADRVSADDGPSSPEEVVQRWEALKANERSSTGSTAGAMGDLPRALPALLRAHTIGQRAAAVKFDWPRADEVLVKVREELDELQQEMSSGAPPDRVEEELGDLLFAIANLARKLGLEPESALRRANEKFLGRFAEMERRITASGRRLG
ncbi:MAG: nucleoside triphosphate pyrophosphohydrolase, partial [Acidobacteria bacterium]|nr:nucleoside triphosphate pyrophosphohydrolase [Acidobacteriota bacterium]